MGEFTATLSAAVLLRPVPAGDGGDPRRLPKSVCTIPVSSAPRMVSFRNRVHALEALEVGLDEPVGVRARDLQALRRARTTDMP